MGIEKKKKNKTVRKWLVSGVLFTLLFGLIGGLIGSGVSKVYADNDEKDYSLYNRASEMAKAFDKDVGPESSDGSKWLFSYTVTRDDGSEFGRNSASAGTAGGLLGYTNEGTNWITSIFSANSTGYSYDQLRALGGDTNDLGENSLLAYGVYGSQLVNMGLVSTKDSGMANFFLGWLFSAGYWFAQLVPAVFKLLINVIAILNPFQLFFGAIDGMAAVEIPLVKDLAILVSSIYSTIQHLALIVTVPIMIGLTAVSIFMFKGSAGKKVLRVVVRVFMIFAGIPLIGSTYTAIIDGMAEGMEMGTPFADYVVMTQFVDAEGWMKSTRLAPPSTNPIVVDRDSKTASGYKLMNPVTRDMVLEINATRVAGNGWLATFFGDGGSILDEHENTVEDSFSNSGMDILTRYRTGQRFSAADYEGFAKSQLNRIDVEGVSDMFDLDADKLLEKEHLINPNRMNVFGEVTFSIFNMAGLDVDSYQNQHATNVHRYTFKSNNPDVKVSAPAAASSVGSLHGPIGLSPVAMYNFLNTEFGETSMTVYSPKTSASAWSSNDYASVTKVSSGFTGVVYAMESLVVLVTSSIIGLVYAFGLFKIAVASIPRILSGVFGTATGSMAMITKLLVSTVVLIVEIIGTLLLYTIFDTLLLGVFRGADNLISGMSGFSAFMSTAIGLKSIIIIVLSIGVAVFSIKNRTAFGKMMEEVATDVITKLMSGLDNSLNQGNMLGAGDIGGAAAQGTVLGSDGGVGTAGSGKHAAALAAGQDPDDKTKGVKDALSETLGQEQARKFADEESGREHVPKSKSELAKEAMGRAKAHKVAGAKDKVANSMGGLATAATMMGVSDLDGNARQRLNEAEAHQRTKQSDDARGIGYGEDKKPSSVGSLDISDGLHATDDQTHNMNRKEIDAMSADEVVKNTGDIDQEGASVEESGHVDGSQERLGNVIDSTGVDTESDTYLPEDGDAASALTETFGDDVETVSMDDHRSHPESVMDAPISEEGNAYLESLDESSAKHKDAMEAHLKAASVDEQKANALREEAFALESKPDITPEEAESIKNKKLEANKHDNKAEEHRKKARSLERKSQKLDAKAQDFMQKQRTAAKNPRQNQSPAVNSARKFVRAEKALQKLNAERQDLEAEANQLAKLAGGPQANPERMMEVNDRLGEVNNKIESTRPIVRELQDKAVKDLPVDNSIDVGSMSTHERGAYESARVEAARAVGQMGELKGKSAEQLVARQTQYAKQMGQKKYASKVENAEANHKQLSDDELAYGKQYDDIKRDPNAQQHDINTARNAYFTAKQKADKSFDDVVVAKTQAKAFGRTMQLAAGANAVHYSNQAKQMNETKKVLQNTSRNIRRRDERTNDIVKNKVKGRSFDPAMGRDINNTSELKVKARRLEQMGIDTSNTENAQQQYAEKVKEYKDSHAGFESNVVHLKKRIDTARQSNNFDMARRVGKQLKVATAERDNSRRVTGANLKRLEENAAGIFASDGFTVPNELMPFMQSGFKTINGDVDKVVNVASDLDLHQRRYDKLNRKYKLESTDLSTLDPAVRRSVLGLSKTINARRNQLMKAGLDQKVLNDSKSITNVVNSFRGVWTEQKKGLL